MKNITALNIAEVTSGQIFNKADQDEKLSKECAGVVMDSRIVADDYAFVAIKGEKVDGHTFIKQVFEKGALCVICEQVPEDYETNDAYGPLIKVDSSIEALKKLGAFYREQLSISIIGVTGSVGKTSTKEFLSGVLSEKYNVYKTPGNQNNQIGVPLSLLSIREEHQLAVIEMGINQFGEMRKLTHMVKPDIAVITNIGECHLEYLRDRDGVLEAKSEIFEGLKASGSVVINVDDNKLATINEVNGKKPVTFAIDNNEADYIATQINALGLDGTECTISTAMEDGITAKITIPGKHMVYNALAATAVARLLGMSYDQIAQGISNTKSVGGRTNIIKNGMYTVIDDCYNANPTSTKAALDLLAIANQRKVAILGDMGELGETGAKLHYEVGQYAASKGIDCIICVGYLSQNIYDGAMENRNNGEVAYFESLGEAKEKIGHLIKEGDAILIKASHSMKFEELVQMLK